MAGIIIDGNSLGLRALDFIHNRRALEQRGREHTAEIGLRRDLMAMQHQQWTAGHDEDKRQFNANLLQQQQEAEARDRYNTELLRQNGTKLEAFIKQIEEDVRGVRITNDQKQYEFGGRQRKDASDALERAVALRGAGTADSLKQAENLLRGTMERHNLTGDNPWEVVGAFAESGDYTESEAALARQLRSPDTSLAGAQNRTREAVGGGLRSSGGSSHVGIGAIDEQIQSLTDGATVALQSALRGRFNGDVQAMLGDRKIQESLVGFAENHPSLISLLHDRENVDSDNPDVKLKPIGDSGYFAVTVRNIHGERAPITQRGSISSENPDDPALALSHGDLYNLIMGLSTQNGGSIGNAGPMLDAALAATAPAGRFGGDGGLDRDKSLAVAQAAHIGRTRGLLDENQALSMLAGEPVTDMARGAEGVAFGAELAADAGAAQALADYRSPTQRRERRRYYDEELAPRVASDLLVQLSDVGKGMGFFDQHSESYRKGLHRIHLTDAQLKRLGIAPGTKLRGEELYAASFLADIQSTLGRSDNMIKLSRAFDLRNEHGELITRDADLNDQQARLLYEVIAFSREKDMMDAWWRKSIFTPGVITDEAIQAVKNNEVFRSRYRPVSDELAALDRDHFDRDPPGHYPIIDNFRRTPLPDRSTSGKPWPPGARERWEWDVR